MTLQRTAVADVKPANPRRGANYFDPAVAFIADFPIGSTLTPEAFDHWAQEHDLLTVPPSTISKQSDTWKAHLQRRNELRYRINKAGTHPRMSDAGQSTFTCDAMHLGLWKVRAPHMAIAERGLPGKLQTLITTKRKQLTYLIQSADWPSLPTHERALAETLYDDLEGFTQRITLETQLLDSKFTRLQHRLRQEVEGGLTAGAGLQGLLALEESTSEESED